MFSLCGAGPRAPRSSLGHALANLEVLTSTHVSCVTCVTCCQNTPHGLSELDLSVNSRGLGKKTGNFSKVRRAHARRVNLSQHQMATPQPSDVTTSDGNPPAIRWRARRRQPPRPHARPRLVHFQSRTGPPHPCGGLLHFMVLYLLTRPVDKRPQFALLTTLRAGLDQLVKTGPFGCAPSA